MNSHAHNEEMDRPDPDHLLQAIQREAERGSRGRLKIYFGMCAGVGKTYHMLQDAILGRKEGTDVVIGIVESHQRRDTELLCRDLEILPRRIVKHRGVEISEFDLDAALERRPMVILVDELAHTNAPGSRHLKRYQDVEELLQHGIDVVTTVNVQHLESLSDVVLQIAGIRVHETIPDTILELADEIELVDISIDALMKRFREGKVYRGDQSVMAMRHFFRLEHLIALREIALRVVAEHVDRQARTSATASGRRPQGKVRPRFLVGIGPSQHSASLIRSAGRLARSLDADWGVVCVQRTEADRDADQTALRENISLAVDMGAEVLTAFHEDVVEGMLIAAKQYGATQILVGKAGARGWKWRNRILKRLLARSGDIDVYVVGSEHQERPPLIASVSPPPRSPVRHYGIAVFVVLCTAVLGYLLRPVLGYQAIGMVFLLVSTVLPLRLGLGPILFSAFLSAFIWDFAFIPPHYTMYIEEQTDAMLLLLFFGTAAVSGFLSSRSRERELAIRMQEHHASALYALTQDLSSADSQDEVVRTAVSHVGKEFHAETCIILSQPDGELTAREHASSTWKVDEKEMAVAAWTYWNEQSAGAFTSTLPGATATYFPLSGPRYSIGVMGVRLLDGKRLSLNRENLLHNFQRQISSALEREFLHDIARHSVVISESERLYKTVFNSISHELRTPLAVILNATEHLRAETDRDQTPLISTLVAELQIAGERLRQLVDDLLNMTRVESGHIAVLLDWCDIRDVVQTTINLLRDELVNHHVQLEIDPSLPYVRIDGGLVQQVILNLLRNAVRYTPSGSTIVVRATHERGSLKMEVEDNGPGVPQDCLEKVFDKFYRVPGSPAGGTGIGLAIVKGFVEAQQGTATAWSVPDQGFRISLDIPSDIRNAEAQEAEKHEPDDSDY